jgi:hypothetical protein
MRTTDKDRRRWVLSISLSKTRRTLWTDASREWSVSKKLRRRQRTIKRIQMSSRCKRTSWLRSFGLVSLKRRWRRKWRGHTNLKMLSKKLEQLPAILMYRILFKSFWLESKPTPNFYTQLVNKKKRLTLWEKTMSSGGKSYMSCKSHKQKWTKTLTGQLVLSHQSSTFLTTRFKFWIRLLKLPELWLEKFN